MCLISFKYRHFVFVERLLCCVVLCASKYAMVLHFCVYVIRHVSPDLEVFA